MGWEQENQASWEGLALQQEVEPRRGRASGPGTVLAPGAHAAGAESSQRPAGAAKRAGCALLSLERLTRVHSRAGEPPLPFRDSQAASKYLGGSAAISALEVRKSHKALVLKMFAMRVMRVLLRFLELCWWGG